MSTHQPVVGTDANGSYLAGPHPAPEGMRWLFTLNDDAGRELEEGEVVFDGGIWSCSLVPLTGKDRREDQAV